MGEHPHFLVRGVIPLHEVADDVAKTVAFLLCVCLRLPFFAP